MAVAIVPADGLARVAVGWKRRWHDFRVDMDWRNGGMVQFYVDGQMVHQATLSGADASCHWDGGIYWATDAPSRPTRTVYISSLSVGVRD